MNDDQIITTKPVFDTWEDHQDWCRKVRAGEIKTTPELRDYAKQWTFHEVYGRPIKIGAFK